MLSCTVIAALVIAILVIRRASTAKDLADLIISPAQVGRPHQRARKEANQPAQRQVGAHDKAWFALDSPLEGDGFEPSVPHRIGPVVDRSRS
jgi:hypothetical protein